MKQRFRLWLGCLLALPLLSHAPDAAASAIFPEALRSKLGLAQVPYPPTGCQLCHQSDTGGVGTATKPFGRSLLKDGAAGGSVPSLFAALKTLEAEGTDSDGDGVGDIAELRAGTDPNVALSSTGTPVPMDEIPLPETGCGLAHGGSPSASAWALLLGALWFGIRRRRSP